MVVLTINGNDYQLFEQWNEITVKYARRIYAIAIEIPQQLEEIYKEKYKKEPDFNLIETFEKELNEVEKYDFYHKCISVISDIPLEVIQQSHVGDVTILYEKLVEPFIYGILFHPFSIVDLPQFNILGTDYFAPESKEVMGLLRPFADENSEIFCDASDLANNCIKNKNKYGMAELITAIIYREKGVEYSEKEVYEVAEKYKDILPVDVYHSALFQMSKVNEVLQQLFPNLYQKSGNMNSSIAYQKSGMADFGWLNSIITVAEMGILNNPKLTPLESVRKTNVYDFMTVLSSMRASSNFQEIFREQVNKKKK